MILQTIAWIGLVFLAVVIVLPLAIYLAVRSGTVGFLRGKRQFEESLELEKEQDENKAR